ncbi:MAG: hypothetical protein K2M43_03665 [Mycoplasmoidaceae bacterium]|nr:hypothetical protein [Mycoplasmoidaceae bacterium]
MSFLFLLSAIIVSILTWQSEDHFFQTFFTGSKDFLGVAIIIAIARGLSLILSESGVNSLMVSGLASGLSHINAQLGILIIFIVFIALSFLIPSTSGFASTVFPIIGPTVQTAAVPGLSVSGTITGFSLANGFVNLFSPTAGAFVAGLALTKTPLDKFYKSA